MSVEMVPLEPGHWKQVRAIYLDGIATGQATFETTAPSWDEWNSNHLAFGRRAAISQPDGELVGWAALDPIEEFECKTRIEKPGPFRHDQYV
ncbi:MAG: GNAT family N-acetyltransferase [Pyrinomonadaceae bacterium]